ncbi:MAG: SLC13 family permease [Candidatus Hodarchaeota archaeon]
MTSTVGLLIGAIMVGTLLLIISERVHKTLAALLGAGLALFIAIIPGSIESNEVLIPDVEHLFKLVELDLVLIIIGITLMVGVASTTGLFEYITLVILKKSGYNQYKLLTSLCFLTMVFSAFLDAYMAIIIISSITIVGCEALEINPKPYILAEAIFADLGGTMTRIASPPNLIIGGHFDIDFVTFFILTAPYVLLASILSLLVWQYVFRKDLSKPISKYKYDQILLIDEKTVITDPKQFRRSALILILTIIGFVVASFLPLELELGYIAMAGGFAMVGFVEPNVDEAVKKIEWSLVFFLVSLLILMGLAETVGILELIATPIESLFESNLFVGTISLTWINALASAVLDNVPVATIMTEVMDQVLEAYPLTPFYPLLVSVVIGTNLGGNITPIGSASTIQAIIILERIEKKEAKTSFKEFLKIGSFVTSFQLLIATFYISLLWMIFGS